MSEAEMNTNTDNASVDRGARKSVSKSTKRKKELTCVSIGKIAPPLYLAGAYSLTSSKSNDQRNINWHESEWPNLPRPALPLSQCGHSFQGDKQLQASSSCAAYEILSKESNKNVGKTEFIVTTKPRLKGDCSEEKHILQQCKMESVYTTQKDFSCTTREVEDITNSITALKMSNKCYRLSGVKNFESVHLPFSCIGKRHSQNEKREKGTFVDNNSSMKLNQEALLINEQEEKTCTIQSSFCDDDFPDLLTKKTMKRVRKTSFLQVQDITEKKLRKKYPRKNDPIFINIGEVLEHSSNTENCKSSLRIRYCQGFWSGNARAGTSHRVVKRGKQREFPKRKALTKLKLAILRQRQLRQESRQLTSLSNLSSCSPNCCITDQVQTVQQGSSHRTSLHQECQTSQQDETYYDFKNCAASCSSRDFGPVDIQSHSDSLEINDAVLGSHEKVECGNQSLNPLSEPSLVSCADEILQLAKSSIHSRKFRQYCNNDKCVVLEDKVKSFVTQIYRFQTKSHFRDADKARIHRRYVLGLREADKYIKLRKLKVLIIATDLEANSEKDGLDEIIENMKSRGSKENLPVIFALKRRDLAYCVYRKVPVSCMAVLNYEGAEELFRSMVDAWKVASAAYDRKLKEASFASSKPLLDSDKKVSDSTDLVRDATRRATSLIVDTNERSSSSTGTQKNPDSTQLPEEV